MYPAVPTKLLLLDVSFASSSLSMISFSVLSGEKERASGQKRNNGRQDRSETTGVRQEAKKRAPTGKCFGNLGLNGRKYGAQWKHFGNLGLNWREPDLILGGAAPRACSSQDRSS